MKLSSVFGVFALSLLALPFSEAAPQSRRFNGTNQALTGTLPNSAPWNVMGSFSVEGRLVNFSTTTGGQIFTLNSILATILASGCTGGATVCIRVTDFNTGGDSIYLPIDGRTDIFYRWNRANYGYSTLEVWDSSGTNYAIGNSYLNINSTITIAGDLTIAYNGGGNWYSGDVAFFRMYSSTFTNIMPSSPYTPVDRAPFLSPANRYGGTLLEYEFDGNITDAGPHTISLTAVGTSSFAVTPSATQISVDRTIAMNSSVVADCSRSSATTYGWSQVSGPASVSFSDVSVASPTVSGFTAFGQYVIRCATIDGNGLSSTSDVYYGAVSVDANNKIIMANQIALSSSAANFDFILGPMLAANVTGWEWYDLMRNQVSAYWYASSTTAQGGAWPAGISENLNYYDAAYVNYQNYYRTGFTRFLTRAQAISAYWWATKWYSGAVPGGCYLASAPREASMLGPLLWYIDPNSGNGAGIVSLACMEEWTDHQFNNYLELRNVDDGYTGIYYGTRESGYSTLHASVLGKVANVCAGCPAPRANSLWTTRVNAMLNKYWQPFQCGPSTQNSGCSVDGSSATFTIATTAGSPIITTASGLNTFLSGSSFLWLNQGETGCSDGHDYWTRFSFTATSSTSATLGSNMTTSGTGCALWKEVTTSPQYTGAFPYEASNCLDCSWPGFGDQSLQTGVAMEGVAAAYALTGSSVAQSVITNWANMIMTDPTWVTTSSTTWSTPPATVAQNNVIYANYCLDCPRGSGLSSDVSGLSSARTNNNEVIASIGWAYRWSQNQAFKTFGDKIFAADFGANIGPGSDGYYGLGGTSSAGGKQFGQSFRSTGGYLANRLLDSEVPTHINTTTTGRATFGGSVLLR